MFAIAIGMIAEQVDERRYSLGDFFGSEVALLSLSVKALILCHLRRF